MRKALSARLVESICNSSERRLEIWDTHLPSFGMRVSKSGKKSWFVIVRDNHRQRRITLGHYPVLALADAREKARLILREAQLGTPVDRTAHSPDTLGEIIARFIEIYAKPKNRGWKESGQLLKKFDVLFDMPIRSISRPQVVQILDSIVANGTPYRANRALAALKRVFSWALDRGIIEVHPILGLKPPAKEIARERVLSDAELRELFAATKNETYPFSHILLLLALTGQRRSEVSGMRWSEVDLKSRLWTIPSSRSKNGISHDVPLSAEACTILHSLPRFLGSDYVFTTNGITPVSGFGRLKKRIDSDLSFSNWRIHDLRRTVASGMAKLGIAPHVVEKVLNHRSGILSGVAAVYNRYGYNVEKRSALESWAQHLSRLVEFDERSSNYKARRLAGRAASSFSAG